MYTHKLITPPPTNQSKRACGSKHVAFYIISLLYCHIPSRRETLFFIARTHCTTSFSAASPIKRRDTGLLSSTLSILLLHFQATIHRGMLYLKTAFSCGISPIESLWWLRQRYRKSNSSSYFSRNDRTSSWELSDSAHVHHGTWLLFYCCYCAIKLCFYFKKQLYCSFLEYWNIIGLYYPSFTNWCMCHELMFYVISIICICIQHCILLCIDIFIHYIVLICVSLVSLIDYLSIVARNYIFSLICICFSPKRNVLDYWGTIIFCILSYFILSKDKAL